MREGDVLTVRSNGSLSIVGKRWLNGHTDYLCRLPDRLRPIPKSLVPILLDDGHRRTCPDRVQSQIHGGVNNIRQSPSHPFAPLRNREESTGPNDRLEKCWTQKSRPPFQSILKKAFSASSEDMSFYSASRPDASQRRKGRRANTRHKIEGSLRHDGQRGGAVRARFERLVNKPVFDAEEMNDVELPVESVT